jgi:hypothetical protein
MAGIGKDLFSAPYHLPKGRGPRVVRIILNLAGMISTALLVAFFVIAFRTPHADNPNLNWELINACRAAVIRIFIVFPSTIFAILGWAITFQAFENSEWGRRYTQWDPDDSPEIKAMKTLNGGIVTAALAIAFITAFLKAIPQ